MLSIWKIVLSHPKTVALLALVIGITVWLWQIRQQRVRAVLSELPEIETWRLEPGMPEIIAEARASVEASPFSGRAWGKLGVVLLAQDFVAEAADSLAQAEKLDPNEFRWPYLRGICLDRTDPHAATLCIRRACELRGDLATPKVQLAEMLLGQGELEEAARNFRHADRLAPDDPRVLMGLGRLALLRDQLDDALRWTERAIQQDPQRKVIRMLLCQILQRRGDQKQLEEQLQILDSTSEAKLETEWPDPILAEVVQYKRGTTWTLQVAQRQILSGQIDQAIARLEKAGGQTASDARISVLLGKAYLRSEQLEKAEEVLHSALQKDPNSAPANFESGNLAMTTGRWDDAARYYREAVRLQPDMAAAHYNLGLYHQHRGEPEEAIVAFELACRYMPTNFPAHREVAEVLLELGRDDEAREHLKTAAKLDPNDAKLQALTDRARSAVNSLP
jgi:tetratricopeptide (TPR) repeat protein